MTDSGVKKAFFCVDLGILFVMLACGFAGIIASIDMKMTVNTEISATLLLAVMLAAAKFIFIFSLSLLCIKYRSLKLLLYAFGGVSMTVFGFFNCILVRQNALMIIFSLLPTLAFACCELIMFSFVVKNHDNGLQFRERDDIIDKEAKLIRLSIRLLPFVIFDIITETLRCIIKI